MAAHAEGLRPSEVPALQTLPISPGASSWRWLRQARKGRASPQDAPKTPGPIIPHPSQEGLCWLFEGNFLEELRSY